MARFTQDMLIAGGGIGGLAAALACTRAGWRARVLERTDSFDDIGAGIQLGPNATRLLRHWNLGSAIAEAACAPEWLTVRDAVSGRLLGKLELGQRMRDRYGAPYFCMHRADLHRVLQMAIAGDAETVLTTGRRVTGIALQKDVVSLQVTQTGTAAPLTIEGDALLGADGLSSEVRTWVVSGDVPPRQTGHLAFRSLLKQDALPPRLRSGDVTVWLGRDMHAVAYPVRGGEWLNLVVLVQPPTGTVTENLLDPADWNGSAALPLLQGAIQPNYAVLRDLVEAAPRWRCWSLWDRSPITRPEQMCAGPIALLGDAAHPMLPYLAQGAAMALEDADALGCALSMDAGSVAQRLQQYALNRCARAGRVQQRSLRNARIFHAHGTVRWGRDMAMRLLGQRLLDVPWLYAGP